MKLRKTAPYWGLLIISAALFSCTGKWPFRFGADGTSAQSSPGNSALGNGIFARIETDKGEIVLKLEFEKTPLTVCNFAALAEGKMDVCNGKPFYDGLTFHRVVEDFMIQGGDPQGNGSGGPGYRFADEFDPSLLHDGPGVLSMANSGPGTNGSQFFITHKETPWLDGNHSVFGRVVSGQQTVDAVQQGDTIKKITIVKNGDAAKAFKTDQAAFNQLVVQAKEAADTRAKSQREAALAEISAKYPGLRTSASGVMHQIQKEGTGAKPTQGSTVQVNYTGMFLSGEVFDATERHGTPFEFQAGAGQVIPGWDRTVLDMRIGEKRLVVIPPELAYGERGARGVIPPNTFLVFEMELIAIK